MPGTLHTAAFGAPATALLADLVGRAKVGDPLAPVTVVVPSAAAGASLRRRLAVELGGLVGVAFVSLPQVAERLAPAGPAARPGAAPVAPMVARAHIRAVLRAGTTALTPDPLVAASAATERALAVTFAELAPVPDTALDAVAARSPQAAAVVELFRRYCHATGASPGDDPAALAAALVDAGEAPAGDLGTVVVHLPRRVRPGEVALLAALAARLPVTAIVGQTGDADADTVADELVGLLRPVLGPPVPVGPPPSRPTPTRLVWAPDPGEEVAMAVREVVAALTGAGGQPPVRPERIAVLSRVRHPYIGALHGALAAAEVPHHVPAVASLAQSVPGRVLSALVDVAAGGFRRADVSGLWRAGPLVDPVTGERLPATRWDRLAREAGVGGGVEQWHQRIAQAVAARRDRLAAYTPVTHIEAPDPEGEPASDRTIEGLLALDRHIGWLAGALAAPAERTWGAWSRWLRHLSAAVLHRSTSAMQADAVEAVGRILDGLADLDAVESPPDVERLRRVLEPELARPAPSHGRFGHGVLVGRLVDGVGADLDLVVVLGAAEGRFPPRRREDPLLPDRVRAAAGGLLGPRGLRREEEHRDVLAALAAAPRRVLVGHRADPREQRERQPAPWFVIACADLAGRAVASADLATLRAHPWYIDVPSFEAAAAGLIEPCTPRELDVADLLADHRRDRAASGVVAAEHPALARGLAAATARRQGRFDEWTGQVGASERLLVGFDRPRSPTGLERYAQCPFRFLLGDVLRVGAIDDPTEAELISPIDEGLLVHQILEEFVAGSIGKPASEPWTAAERDRLLAVADRHADAFVAEGRTGRALLWDVRWSQLRRQLLRILDRDEELRRQEDVSPAEVELAFGDEGTPPVAVVLANGRTVSFKGIIDRVDRSPDGRRLVVYDYKTGSPLSFKKVKDGIEHGDLTARGTKLQLPIYALAARTRYPEAEEVAAHYWFVGRHGEGKTIGAAVDAGVEARFREVIDVIVDGIESGRFPANPGEERWDRGEWKHSNCSWCDYDRLCSSTRGETWVQVRGDAALARYVALADPTEVDPPAGDGS